MVASPADRAPAVVLLDLDDVAVPFHTLGQWQWAWRPNGPALSPVRFRAAVRRSLGAWDRRRWAGVVGRETPADLTALRAHLAEMLERIAGHAVPPAERTAVVERLLLPKGPVETHDDLLPSVARWGSAGVRVGIVTPLPRASAEWLLRRAGIPRDLLVATGDEATRPAVPAREAFRSAIEQLGGVARRTLFVGDLYWSDVHAARRAGLAAVLLDRHDLWPKVKDGRVTTLTAIDPTRELEHPAPPSADGNPDREPAGP